MNFDNIIGRRIRKVILSPDKEKVVFEFQDGFKRSFGVEGDCCSRSWIEHLEEPPDLEGAELIRVENSAGVEQTDENPESMVRQVLEESKEDDCLKVYTTTFYTTRGDVVLEYRNASNGYYGGYLIDLGPAL